MTGETNKRDTYGVLKEPRRIILPASRFLPWAKMGPFELCSKRVVKSRGQIALEFMLLLVFILVFISAVVLPNVDFAGATTQEIERLGQARIAAEKIANTANRLQHQASDAKQTILVFVPKDSNLLCEPGVDGNIGFEVQLQSAPASACETDLDRIQPGSSFVCTKRFLIPNLDCDPPQIPFVEGKQSVTMVIEKNAGQIVVSSQ
jgi:uncharacterized protein (UPF0333 family)